MLGWEPHGDLSYVEINRSIRRRHVNRTLSIIDELFFARTRANTEVSENGITNGRRPDLYHGNKEPASLGAALGALTHTVELLTLNDEGVSRLMVILCVTPIKLRGDSWLH